jgi:F-type H+-transporting ATPase subunit b
MIEINWPLLLVQVATFLVAMIVVWKFSWGPLTRMMQERSRKIEDDIDRASKGRHEVEVLEGEYHRQLAEIEEKARKTINEAVQKGHQEREVILQEAQDEAKRLLEKNQEMLQQERRQVIKELRAEVSSMAIKAMEQLLQEKNKNELHARLVDDFINDLDKVEK